VLKWKRLGNHPKSQILIMSITATAIPLIATITGRLKTRKLKVSNRNNISEFKLAEGVSARST